MTLRFKGIFGLTTFVRLASTWVLVRTFGCGSIIVILRDLNGLDPRSVGGSLTLFGIVSSSCGFIRIVSISSYVRVYLLAMIGGLFGPYSMIKISNPYTIIFRRITPVGKSARNIGTYHLRTISKDLDE